jgi:hypothetical protein
MKGGRGGKGDERWEKRPKRAERTRSRKREPRRVGPRAEPRFQSLNPGLEREKTARARAQPAAQGSCRMSRLSRGRAGKTRRRRTSKASRLSRKSSPRTNLPRGLRLIQRQSRCDLVANSSCWSSWRLRTLETTDARRNGVLRGPGRAAPRLNGSTTNWRTKRPDLPKRQRVLRRQFGAVFAIGFSQTINANL